MSLWVNYLCLEHLFQQEWWDMYIVHCTLCFYCKYRWTFRGCCDSLYICISKWTITVKQNNAIWKQESENHRVHTEWQRPLSGVHFHMMEKLVQAGEGGGCMLTRFQYIYHHVHSCRVRSSWEGRYIPYISSLSPLCTLWWKKYSCYKCPELRLDMTPDRKFKIISLIKMLERIQAYVITIVHLLYGLLLMFWCVSTPKYYNKAVISYQK